MTTDRETWSPNWANTWVADVPGIEEHVRRCVLVASRSRRVIAVGDSAAALHRAYERDTPPSRQLMVEAVKLTTDDEPGKVYRYLAPGTKVVYYALSESTGVIKIGTSKDVASRIGSLATDWHGPWRVLAVEPGSYDVERRRHEEFSTYWITPSRRREGRELYRPGPRLMDYIRALVRRPVGVYRRAEVGPTSARLVLDERIPDLMYRPRLDTEIDTDLLRRYRDIAVAREQSLDEIIQAALVAHLPVMEREATPAVPLIQDPVYGEGLIGPAEDPDLGDQEMWRRITRRLAQAGEDRRREAERLASLPRWLVDPTVLPPSLARAHVAKVRGEEPSDRPAVHDELEPEPASVPERPSTQWVREQPEPVEQPEPAPRDDLAEQVLRARDALDRLAPDPEPVVEPVAAPARDEMER